MPISRRFVILIFCGLFVVLLGAPFGLSFYLTAGYNVLLFMLLVIDFFVTPGRKLLIVSRECDEKLSMGAINTIQLKVRNNSQFPLNIEVKDEVPDFIREVSKHPSIHAPQHDTSVGQYSVMPLKRGEFMFGKVHVRYNGVMGLCRRKFKADLTQGYKVYPNLRELKKYGSALLMKSLFAHGDRRQKVIGLGMEFESIREYTTDDDYRKINWMASARSNKLMVNNYEPETNQQIFIMIDTSRSMSAAIDGIKKLDYAVNAAFLLAHVASLKGDRVGAEVFDCEVQRFVPPGKGHDQFSIIADALYNIEDRMVTADFHSAMTFFTMRQKRRSLMCIFTDLYNVEEATAMCKVLRTIASKHLPLIISIKDTRIEQLAYGNARDLESAYMRSAALKAMEDREQCIRILADNGIPCIDTPPDRLSMDMINKYLLLKRTMRL